MQKIYLAGPCDSEHRSLMIRAARVLRNFGYNVYCPFELKIENAWDYPQEEWAEKVFEADIAAMNNCDFAILISLGRISSAGTNWESGYLFARGIPVYVLQVTESPTSLMTFCGSKYFISTNDNQLEEELDSLINMIQKDIVKYYKKECLTVLT